MDHSKSLAILSPLQISSGSKETSYKSYSYNIYKTQTKKKQCKNEKNTNKTLDKFKILLGLLWIVLFTH